MYKKILTLAAVTMSVASCLAVPPIEFVTALRNPEGKALAGKQVAVRLSVLSSASGSQESALYSETHNVKTGSDGLLQLLIGEGSAQKGDYQQIDWSSQRYLLVEADVDGCGMRVYGRQSLPGVPLAMEAGEASSLTKKSPDGTLWTLTVSDSGQLSWRKEAGPQPSEPAYDLSKVPEQLYYIGNKVGDNGWDIANAIPLTKTGKYTFSLTRNLVPGEIFKFVSAQDWAQPYDWSAESCLIGQPNPMRELENTPEFPGPEGTYVIDVDFYNFQLTITPQ